MHVALDGTILGSVTGVSGAFHDGLALGELTSDGGVTPLPGALPLFATGLGALGLLGWRRKKKAAALAG